MNHDTEGPTNVMMSTMEIWQVKPDCVGELIWVDQSRVKYSLAFDDWIDNHLCAEIDRLTYLRDTVGLSY